MKRIFFTIVLFTFFSNNYLKAQLTVNAGADVTWCNASFGDPGPFIGDSLRVSGGIPPYKYEWKSIAMFPAGHYLDSTSIAHPQLMKNAWEDSILLALRVTDSTGLQAVDTIVVRFSYFAFMVPKEMFYRKSATDTIALIPSIKSQYVPGGPEAPTVYCWSPSTCLSDSTAKYPLCWATVSTVYTLTITDRLGCVADPIDHYVQVDKLGIENPGSGNGGIVIWPNPVTHAGAVIRIPDNLKGCTFQLYDYQGRTVNQLLLKDPVTQLNTKVLSPGMYLYKISGTQQSYSGKIMVD